MEACSGWPLAQGISPVGQLFLESIHLPMPLEDHVIFVAIFLSKI